MSVGIEPRKSHAGSFRTKLLVAMMIVVSGLTGAGLYLAERKAAEDAARDLQRDFQAELASLHKTEELRYVALAERCRVLAEKPRIHAALEDNALDLLYPSTKDELRDVMQDQPGLTAEEQRRALRAKFYRFVDRTGAVLPPPSPPEVGILSPEEESQLALKPLPEHQQIGYLSRTASSQSGAVVEIILLPIISTETSEVIAALVIGFEPAEVLKRAGGMKSGIWLNGLLHLPALPESARTAVGRMLTRVIAAPENAERSLRVQIEGRPHLLFYKRLNPASGFPPVYEVCIYPLEPALARQRRLRWQILGAGVALLGVGFAASHFLSQQLSAPVEKLAEDSEEHRAHRRRAEAVLASTSEELQRSARFSADASHQLKTPVTVLRAGIEGLLSRENFPEEVYDELSGLLHQTYRLTGVIDDLLLLSRMDAGRLRIEFDPVNLTQLIAEWLDDLSALSDPFSLEVNTDVPDGIRIAGEKRYISLILQNLLENARKYNRPHGRIHLSAREENDWVLLTVGNTGLPIPPGMQERIFERFSRGSAAGNVSGHGLGLNLARELARLHGGELRLVTSDDEWTEFEVRFRLAEQLVAIA